MRVLLEKTLAPASFMLRDNMEAIGWSGRGFGGIGSLRTKGVVEGIFYLFDCFRL